jgi:hypothetical protein
LKKYGLIFSLVSVIAILAVTGCASGQPASSTPASNKTGQATTTTPPAGSIDPTPPYQPNILPSPVGDINPTPANAAAWDDLRQQIAAAKAAVGPIIAVFPPNDPKDYQGPSAFCGPHPLSESEKAQVLAIAQSWEPLKQAIAIQGVVDMQVRDYLWKSFSNDSAVAVSDALLAQRGVSQKLLDYLGFNLLPGVFVLFHTSHDSYAYATAKIFVSPQSGKVVFVEASVTAAEPPAAGGWDNVNPDSFRLDYHNDILSPLNPNYDPNGLYGPEGTRFGPPWDRVPGLSGAATPTGTAASPKAPGAATDYTSLVAFLRAAGVAVVDDGPISQSFLSVQGKKARVNDGLLQVFEYGNAEAAAADANTIQPGGSAFKRGNQMMSVDWIAPPHFFLSGRMIVLYVGQEDAILKLLVENLGDQIAIR